MSKSKETTIVETAATETKNVAIVETKIERKIEFIILHCTATQPGASVESVKQYWRETLKWKDPGYHYLIDAFGEIHNLHPDNLPSNGVKGFNHNSIHVSYIGGIDKDGKALDTRNKPQKQSIFLLLQILRLKYAIATIQGHRDFSEDKNGNGIIDPWERIKECPCFDAKVEYKYI